jgi:hypothetical protein
MTRREAHLLVKKTCGIRWVASCPFCDEKSVVLERGYTWGDRTRAKAEVAAHIIEKHSDRTPC